MLLVIFASLQCPADFIVNNFVMIVFSLSVECLFFQGLLMNVYACHVPGC